MISLEYADLLQTSVAFINSGVRWTSTPTQQIAANPFKIRAAFIELLMGEIYLGDPSNVYLYIGETSKIAETVITLLYGRTVDAGINVISRNANRLVIENGPTIMAHGVISVANYKTVRGCKFHRVFCDVDMRHRDVDFANKVLGELTHTLISKESDLI